MSDWHGILVVDDDEDVREMIMLVLALEGYQVVGAQDGLEALEKIRTHGSPKLILLDLRMPRLNGADFVRALRRDPAHASIPIVILSGDASALDAAQSLGALDLLIKPVELAQLLGVASRVLPAANHPEKPS